MKNVKKVKSVKVIEIEKDIDKFVEERKIPKAQINAEVKKKIEQFLMMQKKE